MTKSAAKQLKLYLYFFLIYTVIWLLKRSYRFHYIDEHNLQPAKQLHPQGTLAFACWHQCTVALITGMTRHGICLMVSPSFDGDLTALIAKGLGYKTVRGSSTQQGRQARDAYLPLADAGISIGITVDGPLGPAHKVKPGIIDIAKKCGVPIIPVAARADRKWQIRSWDRLIIPKPFAHIIICYGTPITVGADLTTEAFRDQQSELEKRLHGATSKIEESKIFTHSSN